MSAEHEKYTIDSTIPGGKTVGEETKVGIKRKRLNSLPRSKRHEDIPWTAARCNRLLRTITSRIHILRRLSENNFADKATPKKSPARRKTGLSEIELKVSPDAVDQLGSRLAALPSLLETPSKLNDPEWLPDDVRKPVSKTYAGRARIQKIKIKEPTTTEGPGAGFRSPFIKSILRSQDMDSPVVQMYGSTDPQTPRRGKQKRFTLQPNSHAERALGTLLDSFEALLITTASPVPASRRGASSLLDMCLRKVPSYIDFEQKWAEDEDEDYDFDAIEAVYTDLESFGSNGWSGLREVIREHSVKLIADAMDDRTWPLESLPRLLNICKTNHATRESQTLVKAWFTCPRGRVSNRLAGFLQCSLDQGWYGFIFRTLRELLDGCRIRHSDLSQIPQIWQELLKALAKRSSRLEAFAFFEFYALASVYEDRPSEFDLPERERNEYLRSVMVLITALCTTTDHENASEDTWSGLISQVHRLAVSMSDACVRLDAGKRTSRNLVPFLTGSLILHAIGVRSASYINGESVGLESVLNATAAKASTSTQVDSHTGAMIQGAEFLCDVAKCIAHVDKKASEDLIKDATNGFLRLSKRASGSTAALVKSLAIDSARIWAEYRSDSASYILAEDVENAALVGSPPAGAVCTPGSSHKASRFRWEEGLCEWIKSTPLSNAQKTSLFFNESVLEGEKDSNIAVEPCKSRSRERYKPTIDQSKSTALEINLLTCESMRNGVDTTSDIGIDALILTPKHDESTICTSIPGIVTTLPEPPASTIFISTFEQSEDQMKSSTESTTMARPEAVIPPRSSKQVRVTTLDTVLTTSAAVAPQNTTEERDELAMSPGMVRRSRPSRPAKIRSMPVRKCASTLGTAFGTPELHKRRSQRSRSAKRVVVTADTSVDELGV